VKTAVGSCFLDQNAQPIYSVALWVGCFNCGIWSHDRAKSPGGFFPWKARDKQYPAFELHSRLFLHGGMTKKGPGWRTQYGLEIRKCRRTPDPALQRAQP